MSAGARMCACALVCVCVYLFRLDHTHTMTNTSQKYGKFKWKFMLLLVWLSVFLFLLLFHQHRDGGRKCLCCRLQFSQKVIDHIFNNFLFHSGSFTKFFYSHFSPFPFDGFRCGLTFNSMNHFETSLNSSFFWIFSINSIGTKWQRKGK